MPRQTLPPSPSPAPAALGPRGAAQRPPLHDEPASGEPADARALGVPVGRTRRRLPAATEPRRVGQHHAAVLLALHKLQNAEADVHAIYKALLDQGQDVPLSSLYRALKALEAGGMIRRQWVPHEGRPRGVYVTLDEHAGVSAPAGVCAHCGASLPGETPSASR